MKKIFSFLASFLPALTLCAVPFIAEQPVIDGDLSEPVWRKIPWRSSFTLIGTKEPAAAQTRFKTYNNGDYLFFAVECDEPDTARLVRKPYSDGSGLVWMNDSVEISLVPDSRVLSFYKSSQTPTVQALISSGRMTTRIRKSICSVPHGKAAPPSKPGSLPENGHWKRRSRSAP